MKLLLQGLLIVTCTLLFLECSARGILTFQKDIQPEPTTWFMYSDELGWKKRPGFIGIMEEKEISIEREKLRREFDSQGFSAEDSAQVADSRTPKVITLGDSSTLGYGVPPDRTYTEQLDAMLPDMHVINLGVSGYTSYQGLRVLEKYMPVLNPSLIIVSFNFNDRRYVLSPDDMDSEAKFNRDMDGRRLATLQQKVYVYRLLRAFMLKVGIIQDVGHAGKRAVDDLRTLNARVPPDNYRENLAKMADMARARNIPVIFLVLHDNPLQTQHLNRGLEFSEKAQYDMAAREFMIGVRSNTWFSDLAKKYLAKVYEKQSAVDDVKEIVRVRQGESSVHGGFPLYRDVEYHEIMRRVAREYGVTVVDAGQALEPSVYLDYCHPDERGHKVIATLLHAAVNDIMTKR
jgi:lysophospholipase L1-like esterase